MVFSVFAGTIAFSGGAAAAANVGIDQATEYNDGSNNKVEIVFNSSLASSAGVDTSSGAQGATGDEVTLIVDGDKTALDSVTANQDGTSGFIRLDLGSNDISADENLTVKVDVGSSTTVTKKDIDTTSTSIDPNDKSQTGNSFQDVNVYRGETIAVLTGSASGIEVEEEDGGLITDDQVNSDSEVYTVDTDDLDTGQDYNITLSNGDEESFQVNELNLQVEMDDNDITVDDDVIANVTLRRGGEDVNATLFDDDGDKVTTQIEQSLSGNDVNSINFGNVSDLNGVDDSDGPFTVNVTDRPTGVSVTSDQINVSDTDGDASFETSVASDERGDVVNITYQLSNEDKAYIFIGDEDDENYAISSAIEDDDGDGEVTVQFNSYLAGGAASQSSASAPGFGLDASDILYVKGDDDISDVEEHGTFDKDSLNAEPIEAASYNLNVTAGTTQDSDPDSVGTLRLSERSTENVRSWVAPQDAELDDDDIDVYDRIGQNLTESDDIANKSIVVHEISASGIEGALAYEEEINGTSSITQAFMHAGANNTISEDDTRRSSSTDSNGLADPDGHNAINFSIEKTNVGANADDEELQINKSNVVVVDDPDNNTYFVGVKTADTTYEDDGKIRSDDDDDQLLANFTVTAQGGLTDDDNDGTEDEYDIVERDATVDTTNGLVTAQAAADQ